MATTNKRLVEGTVLTASAVTQYTAPPNTTTIIKKLTVTNTSAAAVALTLYLIPSAGTAGAGNTLISSRAIAPGFTLEIFEAENHVLQPGDFVQALAGAVTSLTLSMSGIEVV